uniref:Uncharacterized protein n=1 Tax=Pararge aegeria TaxID=116150 RepID=S4NMR4_9NEOP
MIPENLFLELYVRLLIRSLNKIQTWLYRTKSKGTGYFSFPGRYVVCYTFNYIQKKCEFFGICRFGTKCQMSIASFQKF